MTSIEFQSLKLFNFRCHYETGLDFPNNQLVALTGKNGHGKSSYFMALMIALYGKTAEGIEISELVNKKVGKNLQVTLEFLIDQVPYKIIRYYKHEKYSDKLYLYQDQVDISEKTTTETYRKIENLLIPKQLFLNTVYFSQQVKDFFTSLTDSNQKKIFNSILKLEEWKSYFDKASEEIKLTNIKIRDLEDSLLKLDVTINQKKELIDTIIQNIKNSENDLQQQLIQINSDLSTINNELVQLNQSLSTHNFNENELIELNKLVYDVTKDLESINSKLEKEKESVLEKFEQVKVKIKTELETEFKDYTLTNNNKLQEDKEKFDVQIDELKNQLVDFTQKKNSEIDTFRNLERDFSDEKSTQIDKLNKELLEVLNSKELTKLKQDKNDRLTILNKKKSELFSKLEVFKIEAKHKNKEFLHVGNQLEELNTNLDSDIKICPTCEQEIKDENKLKLLLEKRTECKNKHDQLNKDINKIKRNFDIDKKLYLESTEQLTSEETEFDTKITSLEQQINVKKEEINSSISSLQAAVDSFREETKQQVSNIENQIDNQTEITNSNINDVKSLIENLKTNSLLDLENKKSEITESYQTKVKEEELIKNNSLKQISVQFDVQSKELENRLSELNNKKILLENSKTEYDQISDTIIAKKEQLKNKEQSKLDVQNRLNTYKDKYENDESLISEKTNLKTLEQKLQTENANLNAEKNTLDILQFWKEGFSDRGIPSILIDSAIPFMNSTIRDELEKIAPGKYIVTFDTLSTTKAGDVREKFSVNILNTESGADSHRLLSGGEKRQIDVCCMRVLRLLAENLYQKKFNITLLDEVLDSLDSENAAIFCQNLKLLSGDQNITLITHSLLQDAECDQVLKV